jgi:Cd2+/Zn2+-exporting ATPase
MTAKCAVCQIHAESVFKVEGMDCHEEVAILERTLKRLSGLEALDADVMAQRLRVKHDAAVLSPTRIAEAVARTGMRAWLEHESPVQPSAETGTRMWLVIISGLLLAGGLLTRLIPGLNSFSWLPLAAAVAFAGIHPVRRAWVSIRSRGLDINVLMVVAVCGAMALGEWSEAASVVFLFALAQLLETRAMDRARGAIRALMDLAPADAVVHRGGADTRVPVDDVRVGELIVVKPGEKIPLDGTVHAGESHVNESPVTGESLPVEKGRGADVFAGTINGRGALQVTVTRLGRDSTIARVVHLVERAQAQRAPSQMFVDRFARVYTPAVLAIAALVALGGPLLAGGSWSDWIYRSLVLLVISCPCALVISTPVSIVSALAAAARKGVLIKGGARLEELAAVRCIAFDKTGTLTHGRLRVVDVVATDGLPAPEVLGVARVALRTSHRPRHRRARPPGEAGRGPCGRIPGDARKGRRGAGGRRSGDRWQPPALRGARSVLARRARLARIADGGGLQHGDGGARRPHRWCDWRGGRTARIGRGRGRNAPRTGRGARRAPHRRSRPRRPCGRGERRHQRIPGVAAAGGQGVGGGGPAPPLRCAGDGRRRGQ